MKQYFIKTTVILAVAISVLAGVYPLPNKKSITFPSRK